MSLETPEIDDWQDTTGPTDGLHGLPEAVEPERPADAIEPPHTPVVEAGEDDEAAGADDRDARGRFRPRERHRARSQQAAPNEVETINALTKRLREAEEAEGADIARQDGESERVFKLRRSVELAERRRAAHSSPRSEPPQARSSPPGGGVQPAPRSPVPAATQTATFSEAEPNPEDATKYPDGVYDRKFIQDYSTWAARKAHHELRAADAREHAEQTRLSAFGDSVERARAEIPDFDAVAFNREPHGIPENGPLDLFLMDAEANQGHAGKLLYHLRKHPAELRAILAKSPIAQLADLSLLVQRLSSPQAPQAGTTGSAAQPPVRPVPKPPNPVRTGPVSASTGPPDDDDSLEAHERYYYESNGRRRSR